MKRKKEKKSHLLGTSRSWLQIADQEDWILFRHRVFHFFLFCFVSFSGVYIHWDQLWKRSVLFLLFYYFCSTLFFILRRHVELLNETYRTNWRFKRGNSQRVSQETLHLVLWPVRVNRISRVHIPRYWNSLHSVRSDSTYRGRSARARATARHTSREDPEGGRGEGG